MSKERMIRQFIKLLQSAPESPDIVNPWWGTNPDVDESTQTDRIRRRQLEAYLSLRWGKARFILLAEAIGFQGGRFTGIPMTSERILTGKLADKGLTSAMAIGALQGQQTSRSTLRPNGFTEPTATIVWQTVLGTGCPPEEFVFWNAFPWHPINPMKGPLSNRTPRGHEISQGFSVLQRFLALFPEARILALGRKASHLLESRKIDHIRMRHPARGGATLFRDQVTSLFPKGKMEL